MKNIDQVIPLDAFLNQIETNIGTLRDKLQKEAKNTLPRIPQMGGPVSGKIYIESVGSIVEFDNYGNCEFLYTPETIPLRSRGLDESEKARDKVFSEISKQFPENSRILNVGAGGDATIPICMEESGHEVISTDLSQATVDILAKNIKSPVFACDLFYLDEVLPSNSVDFFLGNSTLGYVDPNKIRKVVENICNIMKYGGVFTFDLTPHPVYFQAQEIKEKQTVVNESDVDPTKLIEFVSKYGVLTGINAMAYFSFYRGMYTNIAMLLLIKEIFEAHGLSCRGSYQSLTHESGGTQTQYSLRVSKDYPEILNFIENEYEINDESPEEVEIDVNKIWYRLAMIDRTNGEILARKFGIHKNTKDDPWIVAHYINDNQTPGSLSAEIKNEVLHEINPLTLVEKLRPFLHGKEIPKPSPLPIEVIVDQTLHKMIIDGTTDLSGDEADSRIDSLYREQELKKQFKKTKKQQTQQAQVSKRKRKQARKIRKKTKK